MQTATMTAAQPYAFLAQPPASKMRSAQPTSEHADASFADNTRRRPATVTAINAWAASVQPGPPAPISPNRMEMSTECQTRSRTSRRKSVAPSPPSPAAYLPEASDSPTSSNRSITPTIKPDAKHDLQAVGYTSIFVTLPKTPPAEFTPDRRRSVQTPKMTVPSVPPSPAPQPTSKASGLSRLRSLSIKPSSHSRSKSTVEGSSKSKPPKEKKPKYDERPLQMSQELALMQFMGGGSMETHMKRYAEKQAKAAGATKVKGQLVGVGEPHRDARGGVWRDQDEELEYTGLLAGNKGSDTTAEPGWDWVEFDEQRGVGVVDRSRSSMSTQDSYLDSRYAMHAEVDPLDASLHPHSSKPSSKSRRRPEPLTIMPQNTSHRIRATNPMDVSEDARREFLESSFNPSSKPIFSAPNPSNVTLDSYGSKKSVFKSLFKSKKAARA